MKNKKHINMILAGIGLALLVAVLPLTAIAQEGRYARIYSKTTVSGYINRLEKSSNTFRRDFDRFMDRSNLNGTETEDRYNADVKDYERSLNQLKRQFNGFNTWWESRNNVEDMLNDAQPVNTMMNALPFARSLEVQWRNMRNDINKVADTYDLAGLNGGGWNGGGGGGGQTSPPNWATGTFYGTDNAGRRITLVIDQNGNVSANADETPFSGSFTRGNQLSFQDGTSRVTRDGNGFWTTRNSNGERTYFSRDGSGGGGGGGSQIAPPSWATGTFFGTDNAGRRVTLSIDQNGNVSANADGTQFSGSFIKGNQLSFQDGTSMVTRQGNGFWTTRSSNGERTYFSRNGNGGDNGGISGDRVRPPNWAVGTFYGRDSAGRNITLNISGDGVVSASSEGQPFSGTFIKGNYLSFADGTSRVTREGNGFWTTRSSNGERTYFKR